MDEPEALSGGTVVVGQPQEFLDGNFYLVCSQQPPREENRVSYADPALTLPLYREVCRLLEPERRLARQLAALDRACLEGGLEKLVQLAQEYLGNPVLFVDRAFNLLEMAPRTELGVDRWDKALHSEPMEESDLQQILQALKGFRNKHLVTPQIIPHTEPDGRQLRRLVGAAQKEEDCLGGVEIIELCRPFEPQDKILAQRLCDLVSHQLSLLPGLTAPAGRVEQILQQLLSCSPEEGEKLQRRLKQMGDFPEGRFYGLASIPLSMNQRITGSSLRSLLAEKYPEGWCLLLEDQLLLLLPVPDLPEMEQELVDRLNTTGMEMEQPVYLSMPFRSLVHLEQIWHFNREAARLAPPSQRKPGCRKVADLFEPIFFRTVCHSMETAGFIHPAVHTLEEYDRENKTELLETLSVFLAHNCDLNEAARALYVHRNTLLYRLHRVEKLIHMDLKETGTRQVLGLGCKLRMYHG